MKINPINDFGFTALSTEQMRQSLPISTDEKRVICDKRIERILETINPLLEALQRDPEKDKLHWPGRREVVKKIHQKIKNIAEGKEDDVTEGEATKEHDGKGTDHGPY